METLGAVPRRRGWLGLVWGKGEEEREKGRYAKGEVKRKGEKKKETHHEYRIEINKPQTKRQKQIQKKGKRDGAKTREPDRETSGGRGRSGQ